MAEISNEVIKQLLRVKILFQDTHTRSRIHFYLVRDEEEYREGSNKREELIVMERVGES